MYKLFFLIIGITLVVACTTVKYDDVKQKELFSISGEPVSAEEFIYVYEKNNFNNDSIYSPEDIKNYLDLFVNFKLKVKQAKAEGLDTVQSFIDEYESYQSELIKPYLLETKQADSLVKEAYERLQYFIHASHILVRVEDFNSPEDTAAAYQKIYKIKEKLESGADFSELAKKESDDPSASRNAGDLGYFSALRMVYSFENAAYNTPVGEISEPFKSPFGYHILKVHDKVPNKGKVKVAHIAINKNETDSISARNKAFEIYDRIMTGGDWDYLCMQYSDDDRTKGSGGKLNPISQGQLPPEYRSFEMVAFDLDSAGQIGGPVETPYGWHIIKLVEKTDPESFDEIKDQIRMQIARGERSKVNKEIVVKRLKDQSGFIENEALIEEIKSLTLNKGKDWSNSLADSLNSKELFTIDGITYRVENFSTYLKNHPSKRTGKDSYEGFEEQYQAFVEEELYDYEESRIASENLDYRMLAREYYEGLLLFEVMEKYIWSKPGEDSVALKKYFNQNQDKYKWKKRADVAIVSFEDPAKRTSIEEALRKDSIMYFTARFSSEGENITGRLNSVLDSIRNEFAKVPDSRLIIHYSPKAISNDFYAAIIDKLNSLNIGSEDIISEFSNEKDYIISFSLYGYSEKALEYIFNKNSALTLQVQEGIFETGENDLLDDITWEKGIHYLTDDKNNYLIKVKEILPEQLKELNEIRGKVISDYQESLEKEWIRSLKKKYPVVINEQVLDKTIKYFEDK